MYSDPRTYCERALGELRRGGTERFAGLDRARLTELFEVLASQDLPSFELTWQLRRMIAEAERQHRPWVVAAARAILRDWEAHTAPTTLPAMRR